MIGLLSIRIIQVLTRTLLLVGCTASIVLSSADCHPSVPTTDTTVIDSVEVLNSGDTTYVGDRLSYSLPNFLNSEGTPVSGIAVAIQNAQPNVVQLIGPAQLTTANPSPTFDLAAVATGTATITLTASGVHFANNVQGVPTIAVVVAPRPTQIDIPASVVLLVGQRVALSAPVHGGTGGPLITRGNVAWTPANANVIAFGFNGSSGTNPTLQTTARDPSAILVGLTAGTTTLTVVYSGPAGVTLTRTVDVYVLPPGVSRVVIDTNIFATGPFTVSATFYGLATARLFDASGTMIDPHAIRYISRDPAIVTIDQAGCVNPEVLGGTTCTISVGSRTINNAALLQRPGHVASVWIVATAGSAQPDSVLFTVYPSIASFGLSPLTTTISLGASKVFTLAPQDALGQAIPDVAFERFGFPMDFTSPAGMAHVVQQIVNFLPKLKYTVFADSVDDSGHATVQLGFYILDDANPTVQIRSPTATITINAVDHVDVTPVGFTMNVGTTHPFAAAAVDGAGRSVTLPLTTTWRSSASSFASVSPTGVVTGNAAGTATIFASIGGVEGGTPVTVLASGFTLSLGTAPINIVAGATSPTDIVTITRNNFTGPVTLSATPEEPLSGITVNFTSQPGGGNAGAFTVTVPPGLAPRDYHMTLTGTSGATVINTTFTVVVGAGSNPVASVTLAPTTISMNVGDAPVTLTATLKDAGGQPTTGTLGWSTDVSAVASVAPGTTTAQVSAVAPGITAVTAYNAAANVFGRALVRVAGTSGVARIVVSPFHVPLAIGGTFPYTAKSYNKLDVEIVGSTVTWESSNSAVASIDAVTGVVTANSTGGAIITARRDGQYSTGAVTVGNAGAIKETLSSTSGQYLAGAKATARQGGVIVGTGTVTVDPGTNQFYIPGLPAGSTQVTIDVNGYPSQTLTVVIPGTFGTVFMPVVVFP